MSSSSSPSSTVEIASAFIHGAPPGELQDVLNDIQALTCHTDPSLTSKLKPAFQKYNEDQLATAELAAGEKVSQKNPPHNPCHPSPHMISSLL